jgi:hypothetical protein
VVYGRAHGVPALIGYMRDCIARSGRGHMIWAVLDEQCSRDDLIKLHMHDDTRKLHE